MEEEKNIVTVQNSGDKGNPNHVPAGDPEGKGGQFTSSSFKGGKGITKESILAFMSSKKPVSPTVQTTIAPKNYDSAIQEVLLANVKDKYLYKGVQTSFELGIDDAKDIVLSAIQDHGVSIKMSKKGSCYDGNGNVFFDNTSLSSSGKYGGYHAPGATFFHEFFHAIDDVFHDNGNISTHFKLKSGKTLKETFHDEINREKYGHSMKMFNEIKENFEKDLDEMLNSMYSPQEKQEILDGLNCIKKLNEEYEKQPLHSYQDYENYLKERKRLLKEVYGPAFNKYSKARYPVCHKYSTLSDFCSFLYKTGVGETSICGGHSKSYWSGDFGNRPIKEMFAELGSMWSRGDQEGIERIRKYFPDTVAGFEEIIDNLKKR